MPIYDLLSFESVRIQIYTSASPPLASLPLVKIRDFSSKFHKILIQTRECCSKI